MSLELYFHPLSSFCQKVLVALYENDTPSSDSALRSISVVVVVVTVAMKNAIAAMSGVVERVAGNPTRLVHRMDPR